MQKLLAAAAAAIARRGFLDFPTLRRLGVREVEQRAHLAAGRWLAAPRSAVVFLQVEYSALVGRWRTLVEVGRARAGRRAR